MSDSEPEPDVALVRGSRVIIWPPPRPGRHGACDRSRQFVSRPRRLHKARIYAAAAVPVYWIINLVDSQVEVYTDPTGPDAWPVYRVRQDYQWGDLVPFVVDGSDLGPIPAQELLP